MAELFRFSPRPNRAADIQWRAWGSRAFEEAETLDRPILLNLTAYWCAASQHMDETAYSDPDLIALLNESTVPIRVDADLLPHVQERYIAGGWPTNAFLTPTGEVLWSGTVVEVEELRGVAEAVLAAWAERHEELQLEIERRRRALDAARSRPPIAGFVRREAADDVMSATQDAFDVRNGGFGEAPKFPPADTIEPLFALGWRTHNLDWTGMAERTLEGIVAGEIIDPVEGGFFRFAREADWTEPQREKVIETSAGMLRAFALGFRLTGRDDWRTVAEDTVRWAERTLRREDGFWAASQAAADEYFRLDAAGRAAMGPPPLDPVLYTAANAQWVRALAEAGACLGREDWIADAVLGLDRLLLGMSAPNGLMYHFQAPGEEPECPDLLIDVLETALACVSVSQAAGEHAYLERACRFAEAIEQTLWAEPGGFTDHVQHGKGIGALRYRDRPFEANALAARLFLDLSLATAERGYRAVAERLLAVFSPMAGRYGYAGAVYAQAVEEFFDPPLRVIVVGAPEATTDLRGAALRLRVPARRVWTLQDGGRIGTHAFSSAAAPAAFVCGHKSCSPPLREPEALEPALLAFS